MGFHGAIETYNSILHREAAFHVDYHHKRCNVIFCSTAHALMESFNLTELKLMKCKLSKADITHLAYVLKNIPLLCVLDLSFNYIGKEAAEQLGND